MKQTQEHSSIHSTKTSLKTGQYLSCSLLFPIIEHSSWLLKQLVTQSALFQWKANSGSLGQALFQKHYPVSGSYMCSWNSFSFNTAYIFLLFLSWQLFFLEQIYLLLDHCKQTFQYQLCVNEEKERRKKERGMEKNEEGEREMQTEAKRW